LLEGAVVGWTCGDEVVVLLQLGYAEVGGRVCEEDVAAAEDTHAGGHGERKGGGYG